METSPPLHHHAPLNSHRFDSVSGIYLESSLPSFQTRLGIQKSFSSCISSISFSSSRFFLNRFSSSSSSLFSASFWSLIACASLRCFFPSGDFQKSLNRFWSARRRSAASFPPLSLLLLSPAAPAVSVPASASAHLSPPVRPVGVLQIASHRSDFHSSR